VDVADSSVDGLSDVEGAELGGTEVGGAIEMSVGAGVVDVSFPPQAARGRTRATRPATRPAASPAARRVELDGTEGTDTEAPGS
jgi:hypothetical protein